MIGLDTNVLLRMLLRDDEAQAAAADRSVEAACSPEAPCLINRIVLVEAAWVLGSGYGYSRAQVAAILDAILRTEVLAVENAAEAWTALKDYRTGGADFADCLLGRTNRSLGAERTASFDKRATALEGFVIVSR